MAPGNLIQSIFGEMFVLFIFFVTWSLLIARFTAGSTPELNFWSCLRTAGVSASPESGNSDGMHDFKQFVHGIDNARIAHMHCSIIQNDYFSKCNERCSAGLMFKIGFSFVDVRMSSLVSLVWLLCIADEYHSDFL